MSPTHYRGSSVHTNLGSLCWNWHPPLHFRRNWLTDRFLIKSMSYSPAPLIQSITSVDSHSRLTPAKLPLLCQRAQIVLKLQKYTFQLPQYRFTTLPYSSLYKNFPIHILPKAKESTPQHHFNHFIQHHFPQATLIFTDGSRRQLGTGAVVWIPSSSTSLSFSPHSHQSFTPNNQLFSLPSITLRPFTLLAPS